MLSSMATLLLYSTNVCIKLYIQSRFRNDIHYVWCSEVFDSKAENRYSRFANIARSSNPADIYRALIEEVKDGDMDGANIQKKKASLQQVAVRWEEDGEISRKGLEEITVIIESAGVQEWRPVLYVIPRHLVENDLEEVPRYNRSKTGMEYLIRNLKRSDFDVIELWPS